MQYILTYLPGDSFVNSFIIFLIFFINLISKHDSIFCGLFLIKISKQLRADKRYSSSVENISISIIIDSNNFNLSTFCLLFGLYNKQAKFNIFTIKIEDLFLFIMHFSIIANIKS